MSIAATFEDIEVLGNQMVEGTVREFAVVASLTSDQYMANLRRCISQEIAERHSRRMKEDTNIPGGHTLVRHRFENGVYVIENVIRPAYT